MENTDKKDIKIHDTILEKLLPILESKGQDINDFMNHIADQYTQRYGVTNFDVVKDVRYNNIYAIEKKPVSVEFEIDPNIQNIYTERKGGYINVIGYVDPVTKLFVTDRTTEREPVIAMDQFNQLILDILDKHSDAFCDKLSKMHREDVTKQGLKSADAIIDGIMTYLGRNHYLKNIQQQLALIPSRPMPLYNTEIIYSDYRETRKEIPLSTTVLNYRNPEYVKLDEETYSKIDQFFDVFFEESDKAAFTWYWGAILKNEPVFTEHISKMLVVVSTRGGTGKSTLVSVMADTLLSSDYHEQFAEFDTHFKSDNKFATSSIGNRRLSLYHEAKWCITNKEQHNDFEGMDDAVIRSLLTEGMLSVESKYAKRATKRTPGMHIVLTNTLPILTTKTQALARRLLVISVKPTHMTEKAEMLNLRGYEQFKRFMYKHREAFAAYLVNQYNIQKFQYEMLEYDYDSSLDRVHDNDESLIKTKDIKDALIKAKEPHLALAEILKLTQVTDFKKNKVMKLITDGDNSDDFIIDDTNDKMYVNASKTFWNKFGDGNRIRRMLKHLYGETQRKGSFNKHYFLLQAEPFHAPIRDELTPNVRTMFDTVIKTGRHTEHLRIDNGVLYIDTNMINLPYPTIRRYGKKFYEIKLFKEED